MATDLPSLCCLARWHEVALTLLAVVALLCPRRRARQ